MVGSIKELKKICQPSAESSLYVEGYLKSISIYFTRFFLILGMSANQATLIQIILMIASVVLLIFYNNWIFLILSVIIFNVSQLFDHIDGEIARYRGTTYYGRVLDVISHDLFYSVFIFLGYGTFLRFGDVTFIILGCSASMFMMFIRLHQMRFEVLNSIAGIKKMKKSGKFARYSYNIILANFFIPIMYILAFFDMLQYFLYFYGIYIPLFWVFMVVRKRSIFMEGDKSGVNEKIFWDQMKERV